MKKKHLHKASHIAQQVDEPDDDDVDFNNEKGTCTDEFYLNLTSKERSCLVSVMEDQFIG